MSARVSVLLLLATTAGCASTVATTYRSQHPSADACDSSLSAPRDAAAIPQRLIEEAQEMLQRGDHDQALPMFERASILVPSDAAAAYGLARCQAVAGKDGYAAFESLHRAFVNGFVNVETVRTEPDFEVLRSEHPQAFAHLTAIRFRLGIQWNPVEPDALTIRNESAFAFDGACLHSTVEYLTSGAWGDPFEELRAERTTFLPTLAPGQRYVIRDLVDTARDRFLSLSIRFHGRQGELKAVYGIDELEVGQIARQ